MALAVLLCATGLAQDRVGDPFESTAAPLTTLLALTPAEYNNTVADLLGFPRDGERWPPRPPLADTLSPRRAASKGVFLPPRPPPVWPWRFPAEPGAGGFEGITQGQNWATLASGEQERCAWTRIERFAERAWRRPLGGGERERMEAFWQANLAAGPRDEAVALTVAGILQAPAFHFRIERADAADGGPTPWELATRLSYFLWDSMPDDALFAAAGTGELATRAGVERQARRMLDDPKARPAVVHFHNQWLGTDRVLRIAPARRAVGPLFGIEPELETARDDDVQWPAIMGPVRHSMKLETELFVERTVFDGDGTFTALMTDHHGFLSDATAPIYGEGVARLPDRPAVTRQIEFVAVSIGRKEPLTLYPAEFPRDQRAGVLTQPSVLAVGAYAVQPGPILRGVHVLERIACMELGTPVQGAETALPPDALAVERTNRADRRGHGTPDLRLVPPADQSSRVRLRALRRARRVARPRQRRAGRRERLAGAARRGRGDAHLLGRHGFRAPARSERPRAGLLRAALDALCPRRPDRAGGTGARADSAALPRERLDRGSTGLDRRQRSVSESFDGGRPRRHSMISQS